MTQMIFVSLPVADLERSTAFYEAIGFTRDARFSRPGAAAAMVLSDAITFMLSSHAQFAGFSPKPIADAKTTAQVLMSLSRDSREAVDAIVAKAVAAGGRGDLGETHEMGDYMYGRDFEDLDGHMVGVMWMDMDKLMKAQGGEGSEPADAPA